MVTRAWKGCKGQLPLLGCQNIFFLSENAVSKLQHLRPSFAESSRNSAASRTSTATFRTNLVKYIIYNVLLFRTDVNVSQGSVETLICAQISTELVAWKIRGKYAVQNVYNESRQSVHCL